MQNAAMTNNIKPPESIPDRTSFRLADVVFLFLGGGGAGDEISIQ